MAKCGAPFGTELDSALMRSAAPRAGGVETTGGTLKGVGGVNGGGKGAGPVSVIGTAATAGGACIRYHTAAPKTRTPAAKPKANAPTVLPRITHSFKMAGSPGFTIAANSSASQFV